MGAKAKDPIFGARMKAARERANLTLEEVGTKLGISAQAVGQWEKLGSIPSSPRLKKACALYGISDDFAITGIDLTEHKENNTVKPVTHTEGRAVPRLSMLDAIERTSGKMRAPTSYSHTQFPCSESSYTLEISDTSNEPEFQRDDIVVIDPELDAAPGDMVFASVGPERRPVFRRLEVSTDGAYRLTPLNSVWGNGDVIIPGQTGEILGVMSEHTRPRR